MSTKIPVQQHNPSSERAFSASRNKIHARLITGFYQNIRLISMYALLALYFVTPWISYNGHPALLFNTLDRQSYLFGMSFLPQDYFYLTLVVLLAVFLLFSVSTFAGRAFCGYGCPQTIWVHAFMFIEQLCEGQRHQRIRMDKKNNWEINVAVRRALKHGLWFALALATGLTFVAYFVGVKQLFGHVGTFALWGMHLPLPTISPTIAIFIGIFTLATYVNAGWMREQICFHICPYGRIQSAMIDKDTLIVSYDTERGEPRSSNANDGQSGDCIDCKMCVQVCPTGIDIRNGLQMECIQCAACIDACNDIMDKINKPHGLVRYTTTRQQTLKQPTRILRPRLVIYCLVMGALIAALGYGLYARKPLQIDSLKDRNQSYKLASPLVINSYSIKITNKGQTSANYLIGLQQHTDLLQPHYRASPIYLSPGESMAIPLTISAAEASLYALDTAGTGNLHITFTLMDSNKPTIKALSRNEFRFPSPAERAKLARDNAL